MGLRAGRVVEVGRGRHNCSRPRGGMINFLRICQILSTGCKKRSVLRTLITRRTLRTRVSEKELFRDSSL